MGCGILFALALLLFVVPASLEGPVLVPISEGHGLSRVDSVALVPLLAGTALLTGGLWQRRQALDAALTRRAWLARAGVFTAGLGLGAVVGGGPGRRRGGRPVVAVATYSPLNYLQALCSTRIASPALN